MTPECCKNCPRNETEKCVYTQCASWRAWFRHEWSLIRKAADLIRQTPEKVKREKWRLGYNHERTDDE